jgi:hypothetical protein
VTRIDLSDLAGSPQARAAGEAGAGSFPTSTEVTVTRTTFNPKDIIEQFSDITPDLAQGGVQSLPVTMVYEARQALSQLVDEGGDGHVVESLARAVGWAEALSFAFNTTGSFYGQPSKMTAGNGARTIQ